MKYQKNMIRILGFLKSFHVNYGMFKKKKKIAVLSFLLASLALQHNVAFCQQDGNVSITNSFDPQEINKYFGDLKLQGVKGKNCISVVQSHGVYEEGTDEVGFSNISRMCTFGSEDELQDFLIKIGAAPGAMDYIATMIKQLCIKNQDVTIERIGFRLKDARTDYWHIDKDAKVNYYDKSNDFKFIRFSIPLYGAGTEFYDVTPEERWFISNGFYESVITDMDPSRITSVKLGQVARYEGGNISTGTLHKSPINSKNRLTLMVDAEFKK